MAGWGMECGRELGKTGEVKWTLGVGIVLEHLSTNCFVNDGSLNFFK